MLNPKLYPNAAEVSLTFGGNLSVNQAGSGPVKKERSNPIVHWAKNASNVRPQEMIHKNSGASKPTPIAPVAINLVRPYISESHPVPITGNIYPQRAARRFTQKAPFTGGSINDDILIAIQTNVR
mmetsp:Transcript_24501/g.39867  ORF Transcript_24501/g.39867 Transcript_24501/m.39867 type:complete len:125 (+) Transcript_24501:730-1104(+)